MVMLYAAFAVPSVEKQNNRSKGDNMTHEQYIKNLTPPTGKIDIVLDTDAYNEIDDQFAIAYMLRNTEKFNIKGICAAPFFNSNSTGPRDGMLKSYDEILKLLKLAGNSELADRVFKGSEDYMSNECTPVESDAAEFMASLADEYSPEKPLYIVAIGAITNVASAIIKNRKMKENCVIVWLGGHATYVPSAASEFNMRHDIAAARIVFTCGIPLVQLPCVGVVDHFDTTRYELEHWLKGKNELCDYLVEHTVSEAESYAAGKPWSRVIWDVTAVAWLLNENNRFMQDELIVNPIPQYDQGYAFIPPHEGHLIKYVNQINRTELFDDLFKKLAGEK